MGVVAAMESEGRIATTRLEVFDVRRPGEALWTGMLDLHPPPDYALDRDKPRLMAAVMMDVFPESPGQEIVATYAMTPYYASCVRVYRLDGEVLFEAWHPGRIYSLYWMEGPGLIVGAAHLNEGGDWAGRGVETEFAWDLPRVIFAVEPRLGHVDRDSWLTTLDGPSHPLVRWHRALWPPDLVSRLLPPVVGHGMLSATSGDQDPARHVLFRMRDNVTVGDYTHVFVTLDEEGSIVRAHHRWGFREIMGFGAEDLSLVELPPMLPGARNRHGGR